jgi:MFS family permease
VKEFFQIWRYRDLRVMLPARAFSFFGDEMTLIVLMLRVYEAGLGPWSITALLVCAALPVVVLAPLAGRLVDSLPFRRLAVASGLWQAACCVGLAFAAPLWSTYLLVLFLQAGHVVAGPTWQALLPCVVDRSDVGRAVGASQAMSTLASVAAPAVAGLSVAWLGFRAPLLLDAATFLVLATAALAVRTRRQIDQEETRAVDGREGGSFSIRSEPLLWPLLVGLCVLVLAGEATNVVEVFLLRGTLGAGPAAFGLVAAMLAAGLVAGAVASGRSVPDPARAQRICVAASALALGLGVAGLAPSLWVFAAAWAAVGVANGLINADASTLLLSRTPDAFRGRALASVNAMVRGSSLGAMALGGAPGTLLGARGTFVAAGALSLVVALALLGRIRRAVGREALAPSETAA